LWFIQTLVVVKYPLSTHVKPEVKLHTKVYFSDVLPLRPLQLSGDSELLSALLPAGTPFPPAGRLFDVLLAAPLTEELFFRGWLLAAAARAGAPPALAVGASAATFALWHAGGDGGGLLTFGALGAWLAVVYTKGGGRLETTVGAHALWNAAIVAVRVARG